jgi:hypothetical protein
MLRYVVGFFSCPSQDLPFKKGEKLTVKSTSEDPNWWLAENAKGKRGMIPANYVVGVPSRHALTCVWEYHRLFLPGFICLHPS